MARPSGPHASYKPGYMFRTATMFRPGLSNAGQRMHLDQIDFNHPETFVTRRGCHNVQIFVASMGIKLRAPTKDIVDILTMLGINQRFAQCPVVAVPREGTA
jgi:hypothetical protein